MIYEWLVNALNPPSFLANPPEHMTAFWPLFLVAACFGSIDKPSEERRSTNPRRSRLVFQDSWAAGPACLVLL